MSNAWAQIIESHMNSPMMEKRRNITTKTCNRCMTSLPVTEFYKKHNTTDSYHAKCKKCEAIVNKEHYERKKARDAAMWGK